MGTETSPVPSSPIFGVTPKLRSVSLDGDDWMSRLADRVNPLVIREIRQGLRTRVFWTSFGLMLASCLVTALIAYGVHEKAPLAAHGQQFFTAFFMILGLVHFLILPFNAFRSLMKEREEETWVLLSLTGLGPRRILLGKALSTLIQGVLYASAILPFIVYSYFLNGIALPSILFVLFLGFAHHVLLTVAAVCLATVGDNRAFRAGAQLVCGLMLFGMFSSAVSLAGILVNVGGSLSGQKEMMATAGATLLNELILVLVLLEAAASRLMLVTEDYAKRPRRAWLLALLTSVPITSGFALWAGVDLEVTLGLTGTLAVVLVVFGAVLIATDRDGCSRRYRRPTLFRPGALAGFQLVMLVLLPLSAALVAVGVQWDSDAGAMSFGFGALYLYVALFLCITVLMTRGIRSWNLSSPAAQRVFFVAAVLIGSGLPPLLSVVFSFEADSLFFNAFNPLVAPFLLGDAVDDGALADALGLYGFAAVMTLLLAYAARSTLRTKEEEANFVMDENWLRRGHVE